MNSLNRQPKSLNTNSLPPGDASEYPFLTSENCAELEQHCPMSLLEMTSYTDV